MSAVTSAPEQAGNVEHQMSPATPSQAQRPPERTAEASTYPSAQPDVPSQPPSRAGSASVTRLSSTDRPNGVGAPFFPTTSSPPPLFQHGGGTTTSTSTPNKVPAAVALRRLQADLGMQNREYLAVHKFNKFATQRVKVTVALCNDRDATNVTLTVDADELGAPAGVFCERFKEHCAQVYEKFALTKKAPCETGRRRRVLEGTFHQYAYENDCVVNALLKFHEAMRNVPSREMSLVNADVWDQRFCDVIEGCLCEYAPAPGACFPHESVAKAGHARVLLCLSAMEKEMESNGGIVGAAGGILSSGVVGGEEGDAVELDADHAEAEARRLEGESKKQGAKAGSGGNKKEATADKNLLEGDEEEEPGRDPRAPWYVLTESEQQQKLALFRQLAREQDGILSMIYDNDCGTGEQRMRLYPGNETGKGEWMRGFRREEWDHIRDWLGEKCDETDFYAELYRRHDEKMMQAAAEAEAK